MFRRHSKEKQAELFGDINRGEKGKEETRSSPFRLKGAHRLSISIEQLLTVLIVTIILFILVFIFGVWRGKAMQNEEVATVVLPEVHVEKKETPVTPPRGPAIAGIDKPVEKDPQKPYTIQLVAYRTESRALKEASDLTARGYDPSIITRGGFFQVCVGQYRNLKEAQKDIQILKKRYKDCFLRKY